MSSTWTVSTRRRSRHGQQDNPSSVWPDVVAAALEVATSAAPDEPVRITVDQSQVALFPARDAAGDVHPGATRRAVEVFLSATTAGIADLS